MSMQTNEADNVSGHMTGPGTHVGQTWMLEVFVGSAMLCSVAKQYGLNNSLAVDKVQKAGARASVIQLDLTHEVDCSLIDAWLSSGMLLWIHLAPVCGPASVTAQMLEGRELHRVRLANKLFEFACSFIKASNLGILVTENRKNSYFWSTLYFLSLWLNFTAQMFKSCWVVQVISGQGLWQMLQRFRS